MNDHQFNHLTQFLSLRDLLTVWPPRELVDEVLASMEEQLKAEAAEAEAIERKRLESE
jgi:hypothetical protein